ncbi:MAG: RDD family protein [Gammaproteobacteria bacterium]
MSAPDSPEPARLDAHAASLTAPGLLRRLASGFYDALIMLAICVLATFLIVPFAHNTGFNSFYVHRPDVKLIYQLGLLALGYAFFGGFWTHGGQTVGMRTWKFRVICGNGAALGWYRALIRYLTMLIPWLLLVLGLEFLINARGQPGLGVSGIVALTSFVLAIAGFIWPGLDARRLAWHDRLSGTRVVLLPNTSRPGRA